MVSESESTSQLPLEVLERRICEAAADLAAATCRWLELVAEYDARAGWAEWGAQSCAHWLSARCGIGLRSAREHVRVARALGALPLVDEHFRTGELSYSKVRAITRVAQPETEQFLVAMAREASGAQLDQMVQMYSGVIRATRQQAQQIDEKAYLECGWDDEGMLQVRGRLTAEDGAALLAALDAADSDDPSLTRGHRRADALTALAKGEANPRVELVVHVDAETLSSEEITDQCRLEDGPVIAPEVARRLGCDGSLRTMIERDGKVLALGRSTPAVSPALRRSLRHRDGSCRFPGCTHTRFLHGHHVEHWAHGGSTDLDNLILLCSHHHRMVHEGGYTVALRDDLSAEFRTPGGQLIPTVTEPWLASDVSIRLQNEAYGVWTNAATCCPGSMGDSLDYGIAVEGLASQWLPPPG